MPATQSHGATQYQEARQVQLGAIAIARLAAELVLEVALEVVSVVCRLVATQLPL